MIPAAERICRLAARIALGIPCLPAMIAAMEADLFSSIAATDDEREVPRIVRDALIDLYESVSSSGVDAQQVAKSFISRVAYCEAVRRADPVGTVACSLAEMAEAGVVDGRRALSLARLPWKEATVSCPPDLVRAMDKVRDRAVLFSEDTREGLTNQLYDAELAAMAVELSGKLRDLLAEDARLDEVMVGAVEGSDR